MIYFNRILDAIIIPSRIIFAAATCFFDDFGSFATASAAFARSLSELDVQPLSRLHLQS